eukprot:Skav204273  [mRNA]  locus=scaffold409:90331:90678:+ [translate_table: standard]
MARSLQKSSLKSNHARSSGKRSAGDPVIELSKIPCTVQDPSARALHETCRDVLRLPFRELVQSFLARFLYEQHLCEPVQELCMRSQKNEQDPGAPETLHRLLLSRLRPCNVCANA